MPGVYPFVYTRHYRSVTERPVCLMNRVSRVMTKFGPNVVTPAKPLILLNIFHLRIFNFDEKAKITGRHVFGRFQAQVSQHE